MGVIFIYLLLNMMSDGGIDASRVSSVLGYCLLPLCVLSAINVFVRLKCVSFDNHSLTPAAPWASLSLLFLSYGAVHLPLVFSCRSCACTINAFSSRILWVCFTLALRCSVCLTLVPLSNN